MARRRKRRSSPNAMSRWSAATARISRACRREIPAADNGRAAEAAEIREAGLAAREMIARGGGMWRAESRRRLNINPRVASDVDGSITLAQARGRGRGGGFSGPGEATPSQLDRLEDTARLAREAETRVREIDPSWKPEPTLVDPNNIEGRIARNESATRQANERYSEHLRELYGDLALPGRDSAPRGDLTGPRALVRRQDDPETRRGAERENQSADILWLNGHNVEQRPDVPGPKRPDYRIDGEVFDNYAPKTEQRSQCLANSFRENSKKHQTRNVVINLQDSNLTLSQIEEQFRSLSNLKLRQDLDP